MPNSPESPHKSFKFGDWISIVHISTGFNKKTKGWHTLDKKVRVPIADFDLWDMAFQLRHGLSKADALSLYETPNKDEIFMVIRPTTRKHGKRRLKVLNPWTGRETTIFNEQVKQRLNLMLEPTEVERWVLLDQWESETVGKPKLNNGAWMDQSTKVSDAEGNQHYLRFLPSSYFGVASIMCPKSNRKVEEPKTRTESILLPHHSKDAESLTKALLESLGMNTDKTFIAAPQDMTLIHGVPHLKPNMTKGYKTKPSLGAVVSVCSDSICYEQDSLYNVQAPSGLETKSVESNNLQHFYLPFGSLNVRFEPQIEVVDNSPVFSNYYLRGDVPFRARL